MNEIESFFDGDVTAKMFQGMVLNLDLAGIFFVNAYHNLKEGVHHQTILASELQKFNSTYQESTKLFPIASEEFISNMVPEIRNIEVFYEPVVRHFSTVKIMLACCAETFINEVSKIRLTGKALEEFDKLSIVGKWLLLEDLLEFKKKHTIGEHPFQGYIELIKDRNKLVHFKGAVKSLKLLEIPNFLDELNLTPKSCKKNFESIKKLINSFELEWVGSTGPYWLNVDKSNYRNPCFYSGNRQIPTYLFSELLDSKMHK